MKTFKWLQNEGLTRKTGMKYSEMTKDRLLAEKKSLAEIYKEYCDRGLHLDLSRGKPNSETVDESEALLDGISRDDCIRDGVDYRNYGMLDGLPEMRKLFSELFGVPYENILLGNNSSLELMYNTLCRALLFGFTDSPRPWVREPEIKWICVAPGYDRHFAVTETLGFKLLTVPMLKDGPDMDMVEELVKDPTVKGIWCVPKYSNPTGNTYSDETVRRLCRMECGAKDFRIIWDNAYGIHDFDENGDELLDVLSEAEKAGNPNRPLIFASTSKVTLPGAGVSMMAGSAENMAFARKLIGVQTIGSDKINQLRHFLYLKSKENTLAHMRKLGADLKVKFDIALSALNSLKEFEIAEWTEPKGGYFISLDVMDGCAKRVYNLMKDAGVLLTKVGATFPYGIDPRDRNLRLAPTYPSDEDLALSMEILTVCVRIAAVEKLLAD